LVRVLDREYLEDYEERERAELERLVLKRIREGDFSFEQCKYPPDERFQKLQYPVALTSFEGTSIDNMFSQVPFTGSLIIKIPPFPCALFEKFFFKRAEISKIIDFVKETGRIQVTLPDFPLRYVGLDYLDPFFTELSPPCLIDFPTLLFQGDDKETKEAINTLRALGGVKLAGILRQLALHPDGSSGFASAVVHSIFDAYVLLKIGHYEFVEDIEDLIIDDPMKGLVLLDVCQKFLTNPNQGLRTSLCNFTSSEIKTSRILPVQYRLQKVRFPCEIGRFLLRKLTYAPMGLDACKELMYHYDAYDLRKVQESLNDAIVSNHPDIIDKNTEELCEILDTIWNDKTIPNRVKGVQIGLPLSMAAIGCSAAGPIGAAGGFLVGLGYSVADKFIDLETEGLSERLAKLKTRSYQANIYDFRQKYKHVILPDS
jgi:hypothetical protein